MATDEDGEQEQENELDRLLEALVLGYILSLVKASLKNNVSSSFYALSELNQARKVAGYEPIKLDMSKITADNIKATKEYEKLLRDKGGSYVVEKINDTEKLVFEPWLNKLQDDTKVKVLDIFEKSKQESWTSDKIKEELSKIEEFGKNRRAKVAAFTETRVQQYEAQMRTWKYGGLEYVQRRSVEGPNVCLTCAVLNRRVFKLGTEPPLSHVSCRCYYTPYITKENWTPDYDKEDTDYTKQRIKIQDSITSKFK
jgi:hypothetical protein